MKIGFVSLGCPKNLVDSEKMLGLPVTSTSVWPGAAHSSYRFDVISAATCTAQGLPSTCAVANVTRDVSPLSIQLDPMD